MYFILFLKPKLIQYDFLIVKLVKSYLLLLFDTRCSSNFVQILGSIGSVAGGLIVGKEGPLVHVGACIASILGQGGSVRYGMTWKWLRYLKNDRDRRDLVTCGAAAGVAAAFRAPVGGVLFALEEVTSWYESNFRPQFCNLKL
jgi:H+/Cl- antiporter ClcA